MLADIACIDDRNAFVRAEPRATRTKRPSSIVDICFAAVHSAAVYLTHDEPCSDGICTCITAGVAGYMTL